MESPETNGWQRDENNKGWLISVVVAALIVIIFYRFIRFSPAVLLLVFIVLTLIIFQFFGYKPRKLMKFYPASFANVETNIHKVLEDKGLPFDSGNGRYYFIGSNLRIELENHQHEGVAGVLIRFVPYDGTNMPMIMSLSKRLDEVLVENT